MKSIKNLITVIIANYNNAKFIEMAIESVVNQTYKNIQLIIVDDGSTDESQKILQKFIELNNNLQVELILLKRNMGSGLAKAQGLELVKGEFCCFLDSDDYLAENALDKAKEAFSKEKEISLVYTNAFMIDSNGTNMGLLNYSIKGKSLLNDGYCFHLALWSMKHYSLLKEKFCPNFFIAYDIDLYMKLEEVGNLFFVDEPLYYYKVHDSNISIGFDKLGYSLVERTVARYEAQKRRNEIDLKILGAELQAVFEKFNKRQGKHTMKIYLKKYINYLLGRF
jgi:glycosyltransferase involved in cell wall biosynthesis